jgi:KDO2-lipid IV(A) lauroyltransferase
VLVEKKVLCTLGDQSAGPRGYFVDFFGRPASTNRAVALLSLEYDAPIIVTYACRMGPGMKFEGGVVEVIDPRDYRPQPDAPQQMTAAFTVALENIIRRFPDQYFWLHNRWKHQPTQRKSKAA